MSDPLALTMLPAKEGDCLIVTCGPDDDQRSLLIDAGRAWTYKHAVKPYLAAHGIDTLELLVVTHVDRDHIDGMLSLLKDGDLALNVRDVWFNTWDHLNGNAIRLEEAEDDIERFGARMGEELSPLIVAKRWPWNRQFNGAAVELSETPEDNVFTFGDIKLALLSPNDNKLEDLVDKWEDECRDAGITPGATVEDYVVIDEGIERMGPIDIEALAAEPFTGDHSEANGSSIAMILEYQGRKLLFAGDAHADLLEDSLKALGATPERPLAVDAFKVPHHGSKANLSRELLALLDCKHYLVSTNGNYFKHPDDVAIARMIKFGTDDATIHFNYKTGHNDYWDNADWREEYHYKVEYPPEGADGYKTLVL